MSKKKMSLMSVIKENFLKSHRRAFGEKASPLVDFLIKNPGVQKFLQKRWGEYYRGQVDGMMAHWLWAVQKGENPDPFDFVKYYIQNSQDQEAVTDGAEEPLEDYEQKELEYMANQPKRSWEGTPNFRDNIMNKFKSGKIKNFEWTEDE